MKSNHSVLVWVFTLSLISFSSFSQEKTEFLDAEASDPLKMGWMQGFPPPEDKIVKFEDGSFFQFPALRWSVSNMRQFMPTVNVSKGTEPASEIPRDIMKEIDNVTFTPMSGGEEMVIARFASHPVAGNAAIDPTSLPAYHAVAKFLMKH